MERHALHFAAWKRLFPALLLAVVFAVSGTVEPEYFHPKKDEHGEVALSANAADAKTSSGVGKSELIVQLAEGFALAPPAAALFIATRFLSSALPPAPLAATRSRAPPVHPNFS